MAVFEDDFNDSVIDTDKWVAINSADVTITETGGELQMAADGVFSGSSNGASLISVPSLEFLDGSYVEVSFPSPTTNIGRNGTGIGGITRLTIFDANNSQNYVYIQSESDLIGFVVVNNGVIVSGGTNANSGFLAATRWRIRFGSLSNLWHIEYWNGSSWVDYTLTGISSGWSPTSSKIYLLGWISTSNQQGVTSRFDYVLTNIDFDASPPPTGGYYVCAGTLPAFHSVDQDKINALRSLRAAGDPVGQVLELAKVSWPSPDGDIYYAAIQVDDVATVDPPVSPIQTRLKPTGYPNWFLPVQLDASIGDEEVDLEFWDGDGVISDLLVTHGEGIKVELFYWFPSVELLLPVWQGHLRQEDDAEIDICKIKAVQGFRSSDLNLPRRAHYQECQAIFGGVFDTQAAIDENDCPYNKHLGGSVGNLNGGVPYTSCPRRTRQDCIDRLGNSANFMLSHATVSSIVINNQSKGPSLFSASQGNETNLKDPVRVVMGARRIYGMIIIVYRRDLDTRDPDHGWFYGGYEACEGPIRSISRARITVNGTTQDAVPMHYRFRLGDTGQTPADPSLTVHSYSGTALITYNFGWVDPSTVDPGSASASVYMEGLNNIRVYTDETTYAEEHTDNRAWQIMHMLTNKRWGYGYDYDRLDIPSFIEAACWCDNIVRFTDFNGDTFDHVRAKSNVELTGRKVQQQIEDMCMAGRLSRPFLFNGKIHIVPLREMTATELANAPVFTDEGISRNIIWDDGKTSLKRSRVSDLDLPNRIECTFDDADNDYLETPVRPVEDIDQQLRAGRVVGDNSRKVNSKKYPLLGVTINNQAIKCAWGLLDLGPFDEGGLQNNLRLKFKIWFLDSLDLYPTRVIKVQSSQITRYGFDYFRVVKIKRLDDLQVELEVQAYNPTYMAAFETLFGSIDPIPTDPSDPVPVPVADPPFVLDFGSVNYADGVLYIPVSASG